MALVTFPQGGGVLLHRMYTWEQLAAEAVDTLGLFEAFCLAGLAYEPRLSESANPLLTTRHGRVMRDIDAASRRHYAHAIMLARHAWKQKRAHMLLDVPRWWLQTDSEWRLANESQTPQPK